MALSKFLDPKNDIAFKRVFGSENHKDILIHFINDILELKYSEQIESVEFLSPIQDPEIAYKKQSIIDVLCRDKNGVQIIVEMQVAPTKGFEKRAQYYAAKAYSRQLNSGSGEDGRYENLKEVIFIAIANCTIFKDKTEYKSDHVILDKNSYEHDLQDFSFTFIELPKFKKDKISELETIIEKWCYFFKYAANTSEEDLKKLIGSDLVINKAYEALNQFNWTEQELIAYEQELKRIRDNRAAEDYLIEKGKAERDIEIAKNLLRQNVDLSIISASTGLSPEELTALKDKL
ncbi:MAG: Rpn family recombination-promoting nuclease/putative transposase [Pseudomonadota bacterium]